jgi:long-chain fatty acid transport protein
MAGAFVAQADDPSAVFYNPAGIVQLPGTQVSLGADGIIAHSTFVSDGNRLMGTSRGQTRHANEHTGFLPNGYVTRRLNARVSVGLGIYTPFAVNTEWPRDFEGRFALGGLRATAVATTVSPVVAVRPPRDLSVGAGPCFQYFGVEMRNLALAGRPAPPLSPGRDSTATLLTKLSGSDWGVGWTVGLLHHPTDSISLGASYLSEVRHDAISGRQQLYRLTDGSAVISQGATSDVALPAVVRMGAAWKSNRWTLEADAQWTEWRSFGTLHADFDNGTAIDVAKNLHNSWTLRFGGQYRWNEYISARAGFAWDESPVPRGTVDPIFPSGNRNVYCVGLGIHLSPVTIDLAYNYVEDQDRRWNNPSGDVRVGRATATRVTGMFGDKTVHLGAVNVTIRF